MSYTDYQAIPDDLKFIANNGQLMICLTCPRCGNELICQLDADDLGYGKEIECEHPKCRAKGERYGFRMTMYLECTQSILGLNDRPLHDINE